VGVLAIVSFALYLYRQQQAQPPMIPTSSGAKNSRSQSPNKAEKSDGSRGNAETTEGVGGQDNATQEATQSPPPLKTNTLPKVTSGASPNHQKKLQVWREKKEQDWSDPQSKLRKKYPNRGEFEKWMDKQCSRAVTVSKVKKNANQGGDDDKDEAQRAVAETLKQLGNAMPTKDTQSQVPPDPMQLAQMMGQDPAQAEQMMGQMMQEFQKMEKQEVQNIRSRLC
jgi:hypothetical protein